MHRMSYDTVSTPPLYCNTPPFTALTSAISSVPPPPSPCGQWWDNGVWGTDSFGSVHGTMVKNYTSSDNEYRTHAFETTPPPATSSTTHTSLSKPPTRSTSKRYLKAQCDCPNCRHAERMDSERGVVPGSGLETKVTSHNCHIPGCGKVSIFI